MIKSLFNLTKDLVKVTAKSTKVTTTMIKKSPNLMNSYMECALLEKELEVLKQNPTKNEFTILAKEVELQILQEKYNQVESEYQNIKKNSGLTHDINNLSKHLNTIIHKFFPEEEFDEHISTPRKPIKDYLKEKGDQYEKLIGKELHKKNELVILNGLIRGHEDKGVDIITISKSSSIVKIVQCKNWTKKQMKLHHIQEVYEKLDSYSPDFYNLDFVRLLINKKIFSDTDDFMELEKLALESKAYKTKKILFIATEKVLDGRLNEYITKEKSNSMRYKDMDIIITPS